MRLLLALPFVLFAGCSQESPQTPVAPAPPGYLLQERPRVGDVIESTTDTQNERTEVWTQDGRPSTTHQRTTERSVYRIEVLAIDPNGAISGARESWPVNRGTLVVRNDDGTEAPPEETIDDKQGAVVLTRHRDGSWHYTLEAGDESKKAVRRLLSRENPFASLFLPNRRVTLGESWTPDTRVFTDAIAGSNLQSPVVTATASATAIEQHKGTTCVKIVYHATITGGMRDAENNTAAKATETRLAGWLLFDPEAGHTRAWAWSLRTEFEADTMAENGSPATIHVTNNGHTTAEIAVRRRAD